MGIGRDGGACFAAQQLVQGHICQLALDIPQRHVDACHGVVQHRAVAPVGIDHHQVPQVFNIVGIASDKDGLEVILHRAFHRQRPLLEGGTAHTINALIREHLDSHQIMTFRVRDKTFDICNDRRFHKKHTSL